MRDWRWLDERDLGVGVRERIVADSGAPWKSGGIALHDMNGDGTYEIIYNHSMYDNAGNLLFNQADPQAALTWLQASTAVDLELLTAFSAHDFDDSWNATTLWDYAAAGVLPPFSIPQVANFDDDPDPEVLKEWMGHADITTTMRYAHLCPSEGARYADAIAPNRGPRVVREGRGVTTGVTTKRDLRETAS